jgi:hypothetical protein
MEVAPAVGDHTRLLQLDRDCCHAGRRTPII